MAETPQPLRTTKVTEETAALVVQVEAAHRVQTVRTELEVNREKGREQRQENLESRAENYTPLAADSENPTRRKLSRIPGTEEMVLGATQAARVLPVLSLSVTHGR